MAKGDKISTYFVGRNYIDVHIEADIDNFWRFISMYDDFIWDNKYKIWINLVPYFSRINMHKLVMGDLNEII